MSDGNPYQSTLAAKPMAPISVRKIKIKPIQHLQRGYDLIRSNYWQFFGITLVGTLVGSLVPMGLIMGSMLIGIYLCFIEAEQKGSSEIGTVFRGFDQFADGLIAYLIILAISFMVMLPVMFIFIGIILFPIIQSQNGGGPPPDFPVAIIFMYPVIILLNIFIMTPFIFTFQLMADRKLKATAAIKASWKGVSKNFMGIIWYVIALTFVSMLAAIFCYIPLLLLMPISFASMFVLYRDIYGGGIMVASKA